MTTTHTSKLNQVAAQINTIGHRYSIIRRMNAETCNRLDALFAQYITFPETDRAIPTYLVQEKREAISRQLHNIKASA